MSVFNLHYFSLIQGEDLLPVGGTIAYVETTATGATYSFFDANKQPVIVDDSDISSFSNVTYYTKNGTGSVDRYYVFDNTYWAETTPTYPDRYKWVYQSPTTYQFVYPDSTTMQSLTSGAIGAGKIATETMLNYHNGEFIVEYSDATYGKPVPTVWYMVNLARTSLLGGCNDWYIPSTNEYLAIGALWRPSNNPMCWSSSATDSTHIQMVKGFGEAAPQVRGTYLAQYTANTSVIRSF